MTRDEQVAIFAKRLEALMESTASEFDVTGVEVVGVLECVQQKIVRNILANPPASPKKE